MNLYDVYSLFDIEPIKAQGCYVYDKQGNAYLDFYGGHAVISIGHNHPYFVQKLKDQIDHIIFYSNSIINSQQVELASKLGKMSGLESFDLFLCNSGAEANENALKLASFYNGRKKILALTNSFHGRTSAAVNVTDNPSIIAPINRGFDVAFYGIDDLSAIIDEIHMKKLSAVIMEPIQGIGGLDCCTAEMLSAISDACSSTETILIMDEVQSGWARSGSFFAFQKADITPDLVTMGKGMGNGFPVAGVLINSNKIPAKPGLLGSTFGGNHLACTASKAVLDIIEKEKLLENANVMGSILKQKLAKLPNVTEVKGEGLMLGCRFEFPISQLRKNLVYQHKVFTGSAKDPNLLRLLPPLTIGKREIEKFMDKLYEAIKSLDSQLNFVKIH